MFKLEFSVPRLSELISIEDHVLLLGSCFSENIGYQLVEAKFKALINPFGTIYNPLSILRLIQQALNGHADTTSYFEHEGIHYSWDTHSELSSSDKSALETQLSGALEKTNRHLKEKTWIVVTPGTSWVYELRRSRRLVANCHRYPQKEFVKRLLTPEEITSSFRQIHDQVRALNPAIQWLFTVSPVRHIRDGLIENNRSKAVLLQSLHAIVDDHSDCHYFPSYEILVDELRDYRFYERDLIHPSALSIDYIWERFCGACLDRETQHFVEQWREVQKALSHRPRHPDSASHQKFIDATILRLKRLGNKVDIASELAQLQSQLNA